MKTTNRLPGAYFTKAETLKQVFVDLLHLHPGALKPALAAALLMMMFAGLLAAPWLALVGPSLVLRGSAAARRWRVSGIVGFAIASTGILAATHRLMPMTGNIMDDFKMGILGLPGVPPAGPPKLIWLAVTALASAGFATLLLVLFDLTRMGWTTRRDQGPPRPDGDRPSWSQRESPTSGRSACLINSCSIATSCRFWPYSWPWP